MKSDKTSKRAVALGLTAGLVGGGAAGLVLGAPGLTGAASSDPAGIVVGQTDTDTDSGTDTDPGESETDRPAPQERVREALQPLVDDETIAAGQADAVAEHLAAQAAERIGDGHPGHRRGPHGDAGRAGAFGAATALTEVLGLEAEELRDQLRGGSTIAEIAEAQGVAVEDVVAALLAEATERIDAAVESGRIDAEDAAEKTEMLEERVTAHVNGEHPAFGGRFGGRFGGSPPEAPVDGET